MSVAGILTFFVSIEAGARFYHFIKYKDPGVFLYGKRYISSLFVQLKQPKETMLMKSASISDDTDEVFRRRSQRDVPQAEYAPGKVNAGGYMAYINKYGLRHGDIGLAKEPGTVRILVLGESFVLCPGLPDESTWTYILEGLLNKLPAKYEVLNAGAGGGNTDFALTGLIDRYIRLSPDYVMLFSAHNDRSALKGEKKTSLAYRISHVLYNVSQFYAMVREKSSLMLFKDNNYYLYDYDIALRQADVEKALELYRKRLGQIYTVCKENHAVFVLGLQPEFIPGGLKELQDLLDEKKLAALEEKVRKEGRLSYYEFEYYMQGRFNVEMKTFALENGVLLFDGISAFPSDKYPFFKDEIHLNGKGSEMFANALYRFFISKGIARQAG